MAPKKAKKNPRKIEAPIDAAIEFELGVSAADIQRRREDREKRETWKDKREKD